MAPPEIISPRSAPTALFSASCTLCNAFQSLRTCRTRARTGPPPLASLTNFAGFIGFLLTSLGMDLLSGKNFRRISPLSLHNNEPVAFARIFARSYVPRIIILFYSYGSKSAIVRESLVQPRSYLRRLSETVSRLKRVKSLLMLDQFRRRYRTVPVPVPSMRGPTGNRNDLGDAGSQRYAAQVRYLRVLDNLGHQIWWYSTLMVRAIFYYTLNI